MNPAIFDLVLVFLILLLIGSVAMSVFLIYDIRSGNYRKFLAADEEHDQLAESVRNLRKKNLGE